MTVLRAFLVASVLGSVAAMPLGAQAPTPGAAAAPSDSLKVVLLGTAVGPVVNLEQYGASTLVEAAGQRFLFDCGRGATLRLAQAGVPIGSVTRVFLTHLHSDHVIQLPDLLLVGWAAGRRAVPLTVWGPAGTSAMMGHMQEAFAFDIHTRRDVDEHFPAAGISVISHDIGTDSVVYSGNGVTVTAFLVDHGLVRPAFGYRVDYAGRSVVLSGDTRVSENLIRHARGVDVLIHETIDPEALRNRPDRPSAATIDAIVAHHATPSEAGTVFTRVSPRLAVYSHAPNTPRVLEQTRTTYAGPLQGAEDLLTIYIGDQVRVEHYGVARAARAQPAWPPSSGHVQVPIWPGTPPNARAVAGPEVAGTVVDSTGKPKPVGGRPWIYVDRVAQPTMTVYSPVGHNTGAAVVVFPGGGYNVLAIDLEGTEACDWLTSNGITCVLLKYRVPCVKTGPFRDCLTALQDAQRTIGLVRHRAAELHVNPQKIGVLGFSAGGHMVATTSTHFDKRLYPAVDAADSVSSRPDFAIALYPGHIAVPERSFALNPDLRFTSRTPPTLLVQAEDDPVDPVQNSLVYHAALRKAGVPAELHLYVKGGHAFGLRRTRAPITEWPVLAEHWLRSIGIITDQEAGTLSETRADHAILAERTFAVDAAKLFKAFSDPSLLARWWGPDGSVNVFETFDFRPGGWWTFTMRAADGTEYPMRNRFVDIAPERIVIRHVQAGHDFEVRASLEPVDAQHTRVRWRMQFDSPEEADRVRAFVVQALEQQFDRLAAVVR